MGHVDLLVGPSQCSVSPTEAWLLDLPVPYEDFGSCPQEGTTLIMSLLERGAYQSGTVL